MSMDPREFKGILEQMISLGASDLHVKVGQPPTMRIDGTLFGLDMDAYRPDDVAALLDYMLTDEQRAQFERDRELDLAVSVAGLARFRVNVCQQRGTAGVSFRLVPTVIPSIEDLNLPAKLGDLILQPRGLILVTGATGVGKSTTLAAMIGHLNQLESRKVVSVEDPIEYLHRDQRCLLYQREVGADTHSFNRALRHVLRQDPDVIMIGEIRDAETLSIALTAATIGHLVLTSLHTVDAVQTIQRVLSYYQPHEQEEIRRTLADTLLAIVSQRLVPKVGRGRVPAVEILINTPTVKEYILDSDKTPLIRRLIAEGMSQYGSQTFDQALAQLVHQGLVSPEDALRFASYPNELSLHLQGIDEPSGRIFAGIEIDDFEQGTQRSQPEWMR